MSKCRFEHALYSWEQALPDMHSTALVHAPLQTQQWVQPMGEQEQQLFLQEVPLQPLHL